MGEYIKMQFTRTRMVLKQTLENITPEVYFTIPKGFNNNILWQVGHVLMTTDFLLFNGKVTIPKSYQKLFGPGTKPADWPMDVPYLETLLQQIEEQLERIQSIDTNTFNEKLPKSIFGNETKGELAAFAAFHEAMHVGQIQVMKRLIETMKTK